jgi:hypothetical protein
LLFSHDDTESMGAAPTAARNLLLDKLEVGEQMPPVDGETTSRTKAAARGLRPGGHH